MNRGRPAPGLPEPVRTHHQCICNGHSEARAGFTDAGGDGVHPTTSRPSVLGAVISATADRARDQRASTQIGRIRASGATRIGVAKAADRQ